MLMTKNIDLRKEKENLLYRDFMCVWEAGKSNLIESSSILWWTCLVQNPDRISNLFLRSTANLNFSKSWSDFDIKESKLVLTRIESYLIFNSDRVEKIRSMIHCITFHQVHYWWRRWRRRTVKFSDQRLSRWSSEHETSLQSAWSHKCSDSSIEDHFWHTIVSWIFSDSRQYRICI
jgi:hypothetical protein